MITISISTDNITIEGHAGYSARGSDIVCSSISTLYQTFLASMEDIAGVRLFVNIEEEKNKHTVHIKNLKRREHKILIDSFLIGVSGVVRAYPEYVKIIRKDESRRE